MGIWSVFCEKLHRESHRIYYVSWKKFVYLTPTKEISINRVYTYSKLVVVNGVVPQILWKNVLLNTKGIIPIILLYTRKIIAQSCWRKMVRNLMSREINISLFAVKYFIESKEVNIEFFLTDDMRGGLFTNPLQGGKYHKFFSKWRDLRRIFWTVHKLNACNPQVFVGRNWYSGTDSIL